MTSAYRIVGALFLISLNVGKCLSEDLMSVSISGTLYCANGIARGVRVRLWDRQDDLLIMLDQSDTYGRGDFSLYGERSTILSPFLKIYHQCNVLQGHGHDMFCIPDTILWLWTGLETIILHIPPEYIAEGTSPTNYEFGDIHLDYDYPEKEHVAYIPENS